MKDYKFTGIVAIKVKNDGYLIFPLQLNLFCSGLCYKAETQKETLRLSQKIRKMIIEKLATVSIETLNKFEKELIETEKRLKTIDDLFCYC